MNQHTTTEKRNCNDPFTAGDVATVSAIIGEGADARRLIHAGGWTLTSWVNAGGEEPRIRDIELGERLGYERPRDVRKLVERLRADEKMNDFDVRATVAQTSPLGGRPSTEYWLSEAAVLKVVAKSETKVADALLDEMASAFTVARLALAAAPFGTSLRPKARPVDECPPGHEPGPARQAGASALATYNFFGDDLDVVPGEKTAHVVIKRVCEHLGVDYSSQLAKLKTKEWANVVLITTLDAAGRRFDLCCLDLDALPMWLATIEASRVAEHLRPKLVRYQRECARVLRDHFLGKPAAPAPGLDLAQLGQVLAVALRPMADAVTALAAQQQTFSSTVASLGSRLAAVEAGGGGSISRRELDGVSHQVTAIAKRRVAAKLSPSLHSARRWVYNRLGSVAAWSGAGHSWRLLPAWRLPEVHAELEALRRELATIEALRETGAQLTLVFSVANDSRRRTVN